MLRRRLGVLLVVAGLVLGGYVAWQFWGTNWQSERRHDALVEEAEAQWAKPEPPQQISERVRRCVGRRPHPGVRRRLRRTPPRGHRLTKPSRQASGTSRTPRGPGAKGNFALAAHRITHGEPLRDMPSLEAGDEVVVETARATYTYVLDTAGDALEVPFTAELGARRAADEPRRRAVCSRRRKRGSG